MQNNLKIRLEKMTIKNYEELNQAQEGSENDPFTVDRYKQFYRYLPQQTKLILDVGCNTGRGGKVLKELNRQLYLIGLDCLANRLDKIPVNIYDRKLISYSTSISLPDSSVDAIVAGEFIEHLYVEDVLQSLQEFYRVIKPKGRLLLTTPNPNYLRLKITGASVVDDDAHVSQHYISDLKQELTKIGFDNIKILGSGKMSRLVSDRFPWLSLYGSYLALADKN